MADLVAGVTLALTSVPQAVAYAEVSGVAGWRGLSCMGAPCLVYSLLCSSPWTSIGVTSITALMSRSALANAHSTLSEEGYVEVLGAFAVAVGLASLALAAVGGGYASTRIPKSVNAGFKLGFGVAVLCSQLAPTLVKQPKSIAFLLEANWGLYLQHLPTQMGGARSFARLVFALSHPWHWDLAPLGLAALVGAGVLRFKKTLPAGLASKIPPGAEVLLFVGLAVLLSIQMDYDGAVVGAPSKRFEPTPDSYKSLLNTGAFDPAVWHLMVDLCFEGSFLNLARAALTFACVDLLQVVSVCSAFQAENNKKWGPNRELGAQGWACIASGGFGGGPVGVSLSRSLVCRISGAKSPSAGALHGVAALLLLPLAHYLKSTPKAALSAVVLAAILPGVLKPKSLLALGTADACVGWATAAISVLTDPTTGFVSGMILAVLLYLVTKATSAPPSKSSKKLA